MLLKRRVYHARPNTTFYRSEVIYQKDTNLIRFSIDKNGYLVTKYNNKNTGYMISNKKRSEYYFKGLPNGLLIFRKNNYTYRLHSTNIKYLHRN